MSEKMRNIPKLRFPEFRDAAEWEEKPLLSLSNCGLSNGVFNDPKKVGSGYKLVNVSDMYIETTINEEALSLVEISENEFLKNQVENGDIFFTRSSLVKSGIACSNIYLGSSDNITFDGHLIRFRPDKKIIVPIFINYLLKTTYVRSQLITRGKTATMTTIGQSDVATLRLSVPLTPEQKKIADCLSSIDELIASQAAKVEALKEHKKALMQRLFPREGESIPRLRFPEFQNAPKWKEKPLGAICDYWNGGSHESGVSDDGEYFLISLNSLDIEGNLKADMKKVDYLDGSLEKDDLVMVLSDVAHGNFLGLTAIIPNSNYVLNQRMAGLRRKSNEKIVIEFLRLYINHNQKYFKQHGQGSSQLNLSKSSVTDFPVLLPLSEKEQQKIADCLSSVDELIASQTAKVEALKEHKKALMQQLFPSAKEEMY